MDAQKEKEQLPAMDDNALAHHRVLSSNITKARDFRKWGIFGLFVIGGAFYLTHEFADPYRTLPPFPVEKYFSGYQAITGATFRADLRVEAELGWDPSEGRMMVLEPIEKGSVSRRLAILFPNEIGNPVFEKNQIYRMELQVKEGGLIYAKNYQKL